MSEYHKVTTLSELPIGGKKLIQLQGRAIAVFNVDGESNMAAIVSDGDISTSAEISSSTADIGGTKINKGWKQYILVVINLRFGRASGNSTRIDCIGYKKLLWSHIKLKL